MRILILKKIGHKDDPIVILGESGLIGQNLLRHLKYSGYVRVTCLGRDLDKIAKFSPDTLRYEGTTVVNCGISPRFYSESYSEDIDFDLNVVRRLVAAGFLGRYIQLSSRKVYGISSDYRLYVESDIALPCCIYGTNKLQSERAVKNLLSSDQLLCLRISNVFGNPSPAERFMSIFRRNVIDKRCIDLDFSIFEKRDFLSVNRVAKYIESLISNGISGTLNIGCGFGIELDFLSDEIGKRLGRDLVIVSQERHIDQFALNINSLRSVLPDSEFLDKRKAVEEMLDFILMEDGVSK